MGHNIEDAKGRAKEAVGDLTDNEDLKREGKLDQTSANVKDKLDNVGDKAEDLVDGAKDKVEDVLDRDRN